MAYLKLTAVVALLLALIACGGSPTPQPPKPVVAPQLAQSVVFIGDSITWMWRLDHSFPTRTYTNKGIPGQAAWAISDRFQADVIAAHPQMVVILAGTNDISYHPNSDVLGYLKTMADSAKAANIQVVLCTLPPMRGSMAVNNSQIVALNAGIKALGYPVADYYSALVDANGELRADVANGEIHLNPLGYDAITPVVTKVISW